VGSDLSKVKSTHSAAIKKLIDLLHRDSLISSDSQYLWVARFDAYRGYQNITGLRFSENIADYWNGVVLQRLSGITNNHEGKMRFQVMRLAS
jgi:hypothetical protein